MTSSRSASWRILVSSSLAERLYGPEAHWFFGGDGKGFLKLIDQMLIPKSGGECDPGRGGMIGVVWEGFDPLDR